MREVGEGTGEDLEEVRRRVVLHKVGGAAASVLSRFGQDSR